MDADGPMLNEVETYDWVLNHKGELELSSATVDKIEDSLNNVYLKLLRPDIYLRRKNPAPGDEDQIYILDGYPVGRLRQRDNAQNLGQPKGSSNEIKACRPSNLVCYHLVSCM